MKNRQSIFKKEYSRGRSQGIAENVHEGRIPRGQIYLGQLDGKAEAEAKKHGDAVYARWGEVFYLP